MESQDQDKKRLILLKKEYNRLLKRFNKAEEYFDRKNISQKEKEGFLGNFQEVLRGLNFHLDKIEVYTNQEIMEGFDV